MMSWIVFVVLIGLVGEVDGEIKCDFVDPPKNGYIKDTVSYQVGGVIAFECNVGFMLNGSDRITCRSDGTWSAPAPPHCERSRCELPVNVLVKKDEAFDAEGVLELVCNRGFSLARNNLFACGLDGKWTSVIEPKCEVRVCDEINPFYGGKVYYLEGKRTEHSMAILTCNEGFSFYPHTVNFTKCEESETKELNWVPEPTKCMKSCKKPELTNASTNYGSNEVTSGDKIVYTCKRRHHIAGTNDKTQWIGDCMAGFIKDVPTGCIPDNCGMPDLKDGILKVIGSEGLFTDTIIPHGLQLQLECTQGFELVNSKNKIMNTTLATFKCDRGSISDKYYCKPSTDACEAFQLINGNVSKLSIEKYKVTCNPGYKLNIPDALNENCECFNGEVECVPGQKLKCEAEHCRIPLGGDQRLSVYENVGASPIVLSPGETVNNNKYAFFNCSNVFEHRYEPFNRRFKCVRRQWIEADRNPEWTLGNNGAFPECREAKCDPPCSNGGICYKDDECRCSHMTAGSWCEIILCDDSCRLNGGECVRPGVCGNCPRTRRGNNCEIEITCELSAIAARYMNQRRIFPSGETIHSSDMGCQEGYEKSNIKTMTCQQNGTWTGIIECLNNNFKYVVRLQSGNVRYAGTSDNIFLVIHGEHGQTAKFEMRGGISRKDMREKEFRGLDVRPIQKVVLTKDEGNFGGDASILYVSIHIDVDDTYYVFRHPPTETAVWLTVSSGPEFTLSKRPERCIHSYEQGINRKPIDRKYGFIKIGWESLRGCKQQCVTRTSITCKSVYFMPHSGRMGHCYISRHLPESNYFTNNNGSDTRKRYMSYRRVCTNHGNM